MRAHPTFGGPLCWTSVQTRRLWEGSRGLDGAGLEPVPGGAPPEAPPKAPAGRAIGAPAATPYWCPAHIPHPLALPALAGTVIGGPRCPGGAFAIRVSVVGALQPGRGRRGPWTWGWVELGPVLQKQEPLPRCVLLFWGGPPPPFQGPQRTLSQSGPPGEGATWARGGTGQVPMESGFIDLFPFGGGKRM